MYYHIVMWKTKAPKEENIEELKKALMSMPANIPIINEWVLSENISRSNVSADLMLCSSFKDYEEFVKYRKDKYHKSVIEIINKLTEETRVVDFDTESIISDNTNRTGVFFCHAKNKSTLYGNIKRVLAHFK